MTGLNDREVGLILAAFKTAKTPLDVDFEALAQATGLKNKNSAQRTWGFLTTKLKKLEAERAAATTTTAADEGDGNGEAADTAGDTPSKTKAKSSPKKRGRPKKSSPSPAIKGKQDGEEEEDSASPSKRIKNAIKTEEPEE